MHLLHALIFPMYSIISHRIIEKHKMHDAPELCIVAGGIIYFICRGIQINTLEWMNESKSMGLDIDCICV